MTQLAGQRATTDGTRLFLTPAYDLCPQNRAGREASQAMLILGQNNLSRLSVCLAAAPAFLLDRAAAEAMALRQINIITERWDAVCVEAELSEVDQRLLWRRAVLNDFAFDDAPANLRRAAKLEPLTPYRSGARA